MTNNQNRCPYGMGKLLTLLILVAVILLNCSISSTAGASQSENPLSDEQIDERIREYRTAEITLALTDAQGNPLANSTVTVRQTRHKFLFGCNGFRIEPDEDTEYNRRFAELFNYATLPFYWHRYESSKGKTNAEHIRAMAKWCRQHNIITKGHPLVWHLPSCVPNWVEQMELDEVKQTLLSRVRREVETFAGLIDKWDVVNEAIIAPSPNHKNSMGRLYRQIGRLDLIKQSFEIARRANPNSTLVLNDFNRSARYEKLIADCLAAGVQIDAVGIQSHMHKANWSLKHMWDICERFGRFGKPLHFTEMTVLSGRQMGADDNDWAGKRKDWLTTEEGEKRQARLVRKFYRLLFSHPAVEAVTWWDFADGNAWMNAPAGFLRKDMSQKPAYNVLKKLIKEKWWTGPLELKTDETGHTSFQGFLGDYLIQCEKGKAGFSVDKARTVNKKIIVEY